MDFDWYDSYFEFCFLKNINRAIKKASEANTANFSESTFEAYGIGK